MSCTLRAPYLYSASRFSSPAQATPGTLVRHFSCVNKSPCTLDRLYLRENTPWTFHRLPSVLLARSTNPLQTLYLICLSWTNLLILLNYFTAPLTLCTFSIDFMHSCLDEKFCWLISKKKAAATKFSVVLLKIKTVTKQRNCFRSNKKLLKSYCANPFFVTNY